MDRPIPGFYYDPEKKRYFKIVGSGNGSPASATYNTDNVKKRKIEELKADDTRKRHDQTKDLIKRASVLRNPVTGGRLLREFGRADPELPVESWTSGLRDKGGIDFAPNAGPNDHRMVTRMCIDGADTRSGLGVVYASTSSYMIAGSYVPTDENDRINFNNDPQMRRSRLSGIRREHIYIEAMTSLHYHKPSNRIIMTERYTDTDPARDASGIITFSPKLNENVAADTQDVGVDQNHRFFPPHPSNRSLGGEPRWLLGECDVYEQYTLDGRIGDVINARVAPASHPNSLMLLATNRGLLEYFAESNVHCHCPRFLDMGPSHNGREVLSADYHPTNPNIVFAGRRDGKFFRVDRRTPHRRHEGGHGEWETASFSTGQYAYHGPSSVAHLRALDDHQLLAAGPTSAMAVYDVRWMKTIEDSGDGHAKGKRPQQRSLSATTPVVRMYEYTNMPHIDIGLDVAMHIGGTGGGIVAAGQDDGTVGLFSVRTGQKLRAGDIDRIKLPESQGIVKAIEFAQMPWEGEMSLFVGVGGMVKKYSVGTGEGDDEDDNENETGSAQPTGLWTGRPSPTLGNNKSRRPKRNRNRGT